MTHVALGFRVQPALRTTAPAAWRSGNSYRFASGALRTVFWRTTGDWAGRSAPALSPALQSWLQSDWTGLRQTQGVLTRGASAHIRPRLPVDGCGPRPLHARWVRELRQALRLPRYYMKIENALAVREPRSWYHHAPRL